MPVINNTVCETMYRAAGYIEHIPEIFICAGWKKGGFDSCEVWVTMPNKYYTVSLVVAQMVLFVTVNNALEIVLKMQSLGVHMIRGFVKRLSL